MIDYGSALLHLRSNRCVKRAVWPDGVYLVLVPSLEIDVDGTPLAASHPAGGKLVSTPTVKRVVMGNVATPWTAAWEDQFAIDWTVVEPPKPVEAPTDAVKPPEKAPAPKRKPRAPRKKPASR